jgi:hypothetical protein
MAKDDIVPDQTDRLLDALENSTRVTTEVIGQVRGMEREFQALREGQAKEFAHLRETFNGRLGELEEEMKSTNAHLDNLVRETVVTNQLLREDMVDRKTTQEHRRNVEEEERTWRRDLATRKLDRKEDIEDDTRGMVKKYMDEFWGVFKQPFGYLVAGVIFWVLIRYFAVPPTAMVPQVAGPPAVVEQASP